jgi:hypothetical protein
LISNVIKKGKKLSPDFDAINFVETKNDLKRG